MQDMKIEKTEVAEKIFSLKFETQYEVASTFMRLQEFYESPHKQLRNQYFTLEKCMDIYAKSVGNFRYTIDWCGFNVPGNVVCKFFRLFGVENNDLLKKEDNLYNLMEDEIKSNQSFYLIGHSEKFNDKLTKEKMFETLAHEVAHGKYYLNKQYKKKMSNLLKIMCPKLKFKMTEKLLKMGYTRSVINDEIQAYLATSEADYLKDNFKINKKDIPKEFNKLFEQFI